MLLISVLIGDPIFLIELNPLPGALRVDGAGVLVVPHTVGVDRPVEALRHVVRLKQVRIGYHHHLECVCQDVSMLKLLYDAALT